MKTCLIALALAAFTVTAVGCASPTSDDDTEAAQGSAATSSVTAVVKTVTLDRKLPAQEPAEGNVIDEQCAIAGTYLEVSGLGATPMKKLNDALYPEDLKDLMDNGCSTPFDVQTNTKLLMNRAGALSIEQSGSSYYAGTPHPNNTLYATSYDLKTGEQITLGDVFEDASGAALANVILAKLQSGTEDEKNFAESYADSLKANPEWLTFALTEDGVTLYLTSYTGHADFALATEAVNLSYGDLRDVLSAESSFKQLWAAGRN